MRPAIRILVPAVLLLAGSCGPKLVKLDALEFHAMKTDSGIAVEMMDPDVLFTEGARAFEAKRHDDAARKFGLVIQKFPDSRFAKPARFNRGLSLLALGRPVPAAEDFAAYVAAWPADGDAPDAWMRLGQAWCDAGEWVKAEEAIRKRLATEPLALMQEVENRARLTRALRMQARYEEAQDQARKVMMLHDRNATLPEMDGNYYVAMASMEDAESFHDLFVRIKFVLPVDRMEKDLADKATLFLKAQADYLRTVRLRNTYWGVAAGMRVARLYEEFFDDIMNAEIPPELTQEEIDLYQKELKRQVRPLVAKAVDAYERNLALARMYGARDEWFGDAQERLARLRKVLAEVPPDSQ
jgi:hypothetical protein